MDSRGQIDDLFRDSLSGFKTEPSPGVWRKIEKRFFGPGHYLAGIISLSLVLILMSIGISAWFRAAYVPVETPQLAHASGNDFTDQNHDVRKDPAPADALKVSGDKTPQTPATNDAEQTPSTTQKSISSESQSATRELNNHRDKQLSQAIEAGEGNLVYGKSYASKDRLWTLFMNGLRARGDFATETSSIDPNLREHSGDFEIRLKDDYARPANFGFGAHLAPGVAFYDPNPTKKSLSFDLTGHMISKKWQFQLGAGGQYMEDIGKYKILYESYDSIGYFNEVTSFEFDQDNPDSLIANLVERTVYDSVTHTTVMERNNRYFYFTVPLSVGYRLYESRRMVAYLKGGLLYSILVYKEEPTVDFDASDASVLGIQRQVPARSRHNWQFTAGIQMGFPVSNNLFITVEPFYGQWLNSIYEPQEGWPQNKPFVIGLRTGIDLNLK